MPGDAKAQQAMVMGIIACCTWWIPFLYLVTAVPLGILALVFGLKAKALGRQGLLSAHGKAQAGVLCGAISLGLSALSAMIGIALAVGSSGY